MRWQQTLNTQLCYWNLVSAFCRIFTTSLPTKNLQIIRFKTGLFLHQIAGVDCVTSSFTVPVWFSQCPLDRIFSLSKQSSYHREIILSFFHIYLSVNESVTDRKDIDTKTIVDFFLDKFTVSTDTPEMLIKIFQRVWHEAQRFFSRYYISTHFLDVVVKNLSTQATLQ